MRQLITILFLLPLLIQAQPSKVVIDGKISGTDLAENISLFANKDFLQNKKELQTEKIKNGKFSFQLELEDNHVVELIYEGQNLPVYLEPGELVQVSFNADSIAATADFSGKEAFNNNFLTEFYIRFHDYFDKEKLLANISTMSVDAFEILTFNHQREEWDFFQNYPGRENFTEGFKQYIQYQIKYEYSYHLLAFAVNKVEDGKQLSVVQLPSIMTESIEDPEKVITEKALVSSAYRKFLDYYSTYFIAKQNGFQPLEDHSALLERKYNFALRYLDGEAFSYVLAKCLFDFCGQASPQSVQKIFTALSESDEKGIYTDAVENKCSGPLTAKIEKKKEKDEKEEKVKTRHSEKYDFKMVGLDGKDISIDDFRGKAIYVDFWASWCGPCRQQIPYAKELKKMFDKKQLKQIVFLYISIDNNEQSWKNAVNKYEIHGIHARSPGGWNSGAAKYFQIHSIPRFMLIDKQGNIVDPNAKRPSSREEIFRDILMLLE